MRRSGLWISAVAAIVILSGAVLVVLGVRGGVGEAGELPFAGALDSRPTPTVPPTPPGSSPEELAAREQARRTRALDAALKKYAASVPEFSVAVLDRTSGERYLFRGTERYETASVVKVQILACLLLAAQDDRRSLTSTERSLASRMIRFSDNDATTALFRRLGRADAVAASNRRLGLTSTRVSSAWGLTRTTVADQVKLLEELVDPAGPLNSASRAYARKLMGTVDEAQDWGVPVVARTGETATVKNGWLPRSTENNRWIINSVGRISGGSANVSVAVLSHGHRGLTRGISVVEQVTKLTRKHLKY